MKHFYKRYIPEGQSIIGVIHQHWVVIIGDLTLWVFFGLFLPLFLYHTSGQIRDIISGDILSVFLGCVSLKIIYEIANWYNDVWILTHDGIYDLEWSLLKTKVAHLSYKNIEGVEIDKHRIWDSILGKGDIVLYRFGEDELAIYNVSRPYKAMNLIDGYLYPQEEKKERFDLIMDTLGNVVEDYLDKNGLRHRYDEDEDDNISENEEESIDEYTLDLRGK